MGSYEDDELRRKPKIPKLEAELENGGQISETSMASLSSSLSKDELTDDELATLSRHVRAQVDLLYSTFSWNEADRATANRATHFLADVANNGKMKVVNILVDSGAVPVLVKHMQAPPSSDDHNGLKPFEHEVEEGSVLALGLIALKRKHQQLIVDHGAMPHLVNLLKSHKVFSSSRAASIVIQRAADVITNLALENSSIKVCVRLEGGIPPLVELLDFYDNTVQLAAARALSTLASEDDENKNLIVECNALPALIQMLGSQDSTIHYGAVSVIGNLVYSSPTRTSQVLLAGALQPVIGLLSSFCMESRKEAALLLGQFATESPHKVDIVQSGAVGPLIQFLHSPDLRLKELSIFALGRVAKDSHNQAGIVHSGGLEPLLKLLEDMNLPLNLKHSVALVLYMLADNKDNVSDFIKTGAVQKLLKGDFLPTTRDYVAHTLKRLEEKIHGWVLDDLLNLMRVGEKDIQRKVSLALSHFCSPENIRTIFMNSDGLELLLELLGLTDQNQQLDASKALCKLLQKAMRLPPLPEVFGSPSYPTEKVYLGEQYVNNASLSDVIFVVEGKQFYAHSRCLWPSSEVFRATLDRVYQGNLTEIEVRDITWEVFESMMRYIYTGSVVVKLEIAQDLLRAAEQYQLGSLKLDCEYTLMRGISAENVVSIYELSETSSNVPLRLKCIEYILEHFDKLTSRPGFVQLIQRLIPEIRSYIGNKLSRSDRKVAVVYDRPC